MSIAERSSPDAVDELCAAVAALVDSTKEVVDGQCWTDARLRFPAVGNIMVSYREI